MTPNDMVEWMFYSCRFVIAFVATYGYHDACLKLTQGLLR